MAAGVRRTADFEVGVWRQAPAPECGHCYEEIGPGTPVVYHKDGDRNCHPVSLDCYADAHIARIAPSSCPTCHVEISAVSARVFGQYGLLDLARGEYPADLFRSGSELYQTILRELLSVREHWLPIFLQLCEENNFRKVYSIIQILGDRLGADILGEVLVKAFEKGHYLIVRQILRSERFPRDFSPVILRRALAAVGERRQHGWVVGALVNSPACAQVAVAALKAAARNGLDEAVVYLSHHAEARRYIRLEHVLAAVEQAQQAARVQTIQALMQSFCEAEWRLPLLDRLGAIAERQEIREVPAWALEAPFAGQVLGQAICLGQERFTRLLIERPAFQSIRVMGWGIIQSIRCGRYQLMTELFARLCTVQGQNIARFLHAEDWKRGYGLLRGKVTEYWVLGEQSVRVQKVLMWLELFPVVGPWIIAGKGGMRVFRAREGSEGADVAVRKALMTAIAIRTTAYVAQCLIAPMLVKGVIRSFNWIAPDLVSCTVAFLAAMRYRFLPWVWQRMGGDPVWCGSSWNDEQRTRLWLRSLFLAIAKYAVEMGVSGAGLALTKERLAARLVSPSR